MEQGAPHEAGRDGGEGPEPRDAAVDHLAFDDCIALLRAGDIGRIAVVVNEFPVMLPVNYRLVEGTGFNWVAVRTRPGNVVDQAGLPAAFEIDGIDEARLTGWSVLVRGTLHHVDPDAAGFRERFDPHPWLVSDRHAWLVVVPFSITGRRLRRTSPWPFALDAYL